MITSATPVIVKLQLRARLIPLWHGLPARVFFSNHGLVARATMRPRNCHPGPRMRLRRTHEERNWVPLAACLPVRACEEGTGRQAASGTRVAVSGNDFQSSEAKDLALRGRARSFASLRLTVPVPDGQQLFTSARA